MLANKLLGVRPVNPLNVEVTSAAVLELVKMGGLGGLTGADEVTDGLISAAMENNEGLLLLLV